MRCIVTGSRNWSRPDVVWTCLNVLATEAASVGETELVVVHGACFPKRRDPVTGQFPLESADHLADLWCRRGGHPLPVRAERHPANWRANRRAAGHIRNQRMADLGADVCLAFHRDDSPGTAGVIRIAERAGIPTQVVNYADLQPLNPSEKTRV